MVSLIVDKEPPVVDKEPLIVDKEPPVVDKKPPVVDRKPLIANKEPLIVKVICHFRGPSLQKKGHFVLTKIMRRQQLYELLFQFVLFLY